MTPTIWIGRDNLLSLQCYADDVAVDLTAYTNYGLRIGALVRKHSDQAGIFTAKPNGVLEIKAGLFPSLVAGEASAQVLLFNTSNPNGIALDFFRVRVCS